MVAEFGARSRAALHGRGPAPLAPNIHMHKKQKTRHIMWSSFCEIAVVPFK